MDLVEGYSDFPSFIDYINYHEKVRLNIINKGDGRE